MQEMSMAFERFFKKFADFVQMRRLFPLEIKNNLANS
jgi:hypothetical protein